MNEVIPYTECIKAAFTFVQSPAANRQEKIELGRRLIDSLLAQMYAANEVKGITIFALGGIISLWKKEELWREIPEYREYWEFGDFCRTVLKMSVQKANSLVRIWEKSQQIDLRPAEIEDIGWSKAQHIIRVAKNRKDVEEWIGKARRMSLPVFVDEVKESIARGRHEQEHKTKSVKKTFVVSEEEAVFIDETIERSARLRKLDLGINTTPSKELIFILFDWREMRAGEE